VRSAADARTTRIAPTDLEPPLAAETALRSGQAESAADAVIGVVSLAVAAARTALAVGTRVPRPVLASLRVPPVVHALMRSTWLAAAARGRIDRSAVTERVLHLVDALTPRLAREVLTRVDVTGLVAEFVDLDRIIAHVDLDSAVAHVDIGAVVARLDLDAVLASVDVDELLERVDVQSVVDRIDIEGLIERIDVAGVVERIDVAAVIDRVDIDSVVDRIDIDGVVDRVDLLALARYVVDGIDLAGLIRTSTGSVASEVVRGVRSQGADADQAVERVVDRLLLRRHGRRTGPAEPPRRTPAENRDGTPGRDAR
jgi:hypothetical protein